MFRYLLFTFFLAVLSVRAESGLLWHHQNQLNSAGRQLAELLLPDPLAFDAMLPAERDAWLTMEWQQVLARRERYAQQPLPREWGRAGFELAKQQGELESYMARQVPGYRDYRLLKRHYHRLGEVTAFTTIPAGPELRVGERDRVVPALRRRLEQMGLAVPAPSGRLDALDHDLGRVLTGLQQAHGLTASGRLDEATRALLNRTPGQVRRHIRHSLQRWLWLPPVAPDTFVLVNIPASRLILYRHSEPDFGMKVAVGHPDWPTPEFGTRLSALKVNPDWTPTASILREELLPAQRRDSGFLARNGFIARVKGADGWVSRQPAEVDLTSPQVRLVQQPGPSNALGRYKFEMPNPHSVYLHDTPDRQVFSAANRAVSHGCVRLERAGELARRLGWRPPEHNRTLTLKANGTIPVYLLYLTAWVDEQDGLVLSPDVYNRQG